MLYCNSIRAVLTAQIFIFAGSLSPLCAQTPPSLSSSPYTHTMRIAGMIEQEMIAREQSSNDLSFPPATPRVQTQSSPAPQANPHIPPAPVAAQNTPQNMMPASPPALAPAPAAAAPIAAQKLALLKPDTQTTRPMPTINQKFMKQEVAYDGPEAIGTIIVDTENHFLYLVTAKGQALRYGIGVGRAGFEWKGTEKISRKAEWPDWFPPEDMLKRRPDLPLHMAGGVNNPLGARALYLGSTLYRIHGTNEPWTIGMSMSSGCIRMMNDDVIDLYNRVDVGTRVIVK